MESWVTAQPAEELTAEGGLVLRRWRDEHLAAMVTALVASKAHLAPWMPWAVKWQPADAGEFIAMTNGGWDDRTDFSWGVWDGDQVIGACGLHTRIGVAKLELGYWTHIDRIGEGVAPRAAAAVTGAAFTIPGVKAVEIHHDLSNARSARVPEILGYRRLADVPRSAEEGGGEATAVWEMLRDDWRG